MLRSVARQYNDILLESERDYLRRAFTLSVDAQRLYARLLTRKGPLIRIDSLCYREVFDVAGALAELEASALLQRDPPLPADQFLERLTRDELAALFPYIRVARKDLQVDTIAARYPDHHVREVVARRHGMCVTLDGERLSLMQTLFFGESRADLSTFVLEDLGMWRFETYALDPGRRQFRDRPELDDFLAMSALRLPLHRLEARWQHDVAVEVLAALWDIRERRALERVRGGLVNLLGRCAERAADYDVALSAYGRASRAPGRERRVRLLRRLGDHAAAAASLDAIERAPLSAGERYFAQQFRLPRRRTRRGPTERVQRICAPPTDGVEAAALAALTRDGGDGRHLENLASLGMLGLAFWDVIFAPVDGAFVNPYQDRPLDLYWNDFRRHSFGGDFRAPRGTRATLRADARGLCDASSEVRHQQRARRLARARCAIHPPRRAMRAYARVAHDLRLHARRPGTDSHGISRPHAVVRSRTVPIRRGEGTR